MKPRAFEPSTLSTLAPNDRLQFPKFGLGKHLDPPFHCIHHAFEFYASQYPDTIAVEDSQKKISFSELNHQANCLAVRLRTMGVAPTARICLLVERSIFMVIAIFGVLKAGAAYVPLDGNIVSDSTLSHAFKDSESSLFLCQRKFSQRTDDFPTLCLEDSLCTSLSSTHCEKPDDLSNPGHSAYIIYTSGTTGIPKGVDVMHKNVTNLVCLAPGDLGMRHGIRVSQLMNISFDMAAWEILGSLCNGSTLVLRGKTSQEWRATMKTVNVVIATPSMLASHNPSDYPTIKTVAVAGEPCPKSLADNWSKTVSFCNCCGPTGVTIVNTMQLYTSQKPLGIGGPTPNNTVYVLDEQMKHVSVGDVGVMWAGGSGITRGYLNLPEKTADKYKLDPFLNDSSVMFNTGDLGRWNPYGDLEHLGRVDDQVKVKGFRVELDGVASAMETCPGVKAATAILVNEELWGFFTPTSVNMADVQAAAARVQPYYAVPTKFTRLDQIPETSNGKTDKRVLREMALSSQATESAPAIPQLIHIHDGDKRTRVVKKRDAPSIASITVPTSQNSSDPNLTISKHTYPDTASSLSFDGKGKTEPSTLEDQTFSWSGYMDDVLPDKSQGRFMRNLRHQILYLYRRLFGVVFVTNVAIFISVAIQGSNSLQVGRIVVANLFVAILMRQDYVIDMFFTVFTSVPSSWPLCIRSVCARVYHIGGLHSGCGVSGVLWLILFTTRATKEYNDHDKISMTTISVTYIILALLLGILVLAHPMFRRIHHDGFEISHRLMGWAATALVWIQVISLTNDWKTPDQALGGVLVSSAPFWLILVMTLSLILPWIRLRRVSVQSELLSAHAVRLYFDYVTPKTGSFVRLSDSPWTEWHGFATVPEPGMRGFSLVVSKAGDWTARQIANPPTKIWVRGVPTYGVIRIVPLFRRLVIVATGSGIGPCMPAILEKRIPIRLLWTAPNVRETFGDKLVDSIIYAAPDAVIYNTRTHGKPDMVKLTHRIVKGFDAEAVVIISNQKLTEKVVYGMLSRGIPAFGAIWDS